MCLSLLGLLKHVCLLLIRLKITSYKTTLNSCSCGVDRSYGSSGDSQVHENPEWEKARQALASISKSQSAAKTTQANRTTAEVSFFVFVLFFF